MKQLEVAIKDAFSGDSYSVLVEQINMSYDVNGIMNINPITGHSQSHSYKFEKNKNGGIDMSYR